MDSKVILFDGKLLYTDNSGVYKKFDHYNEITKMKKFVLTRGSTSMHLKVFLTNAFLLRPRRDHQL